MAQPAWEEGAVVYLRKTGLCTVLRHAEHDVGAARVLCYELDRPTGVIRIPVDRTAELLRAPVTRAEAAEMLAILREADRAPDLLPVRHAARSHHAAMAALETPRDHADYLRRLYALPAPLTRWEQTAVLHLEELVLDEIAWVLGIPRAELVAELRQLHPAMRTAPLG